MANLDNFIIKGQITATSNKTKGDDEEKKRKIAYIKVEDEVSNLLKNTYGLTEYSGGTGEKFFILKLANGVNLWTALSEEPIVIDTSITSRNFKTPKEIEINIISGIDPKFNKKFFRITDLLVEDETKDIEYLERVNPFKQN